MVKTVNLVSLLVLASLLAGPSLLRAPPQTPVRTLVDIQKTAISTDVTTIVGTPTIEMRTYPTMRPRMKARFDKIAARIRAESIRKMQTHSLPRMKQFNQNSTKASSKNSQENTSGNPIEKTTLKPHHIDSQHRSYLLFQLWDYVRTGLQSSFQSFQKLIRRNNTVTRKRPLSTFLRFG